MPVQFVCQKCRKRLSVSQRKQGAVVECPKCGQPNVVPDERAAPPSAAMAASAQQTAGAPAIPEVLVFDDVPDLIADRQHSTMLASAELALKTAPNEASATFEAATVPPPKPPDVWPNSAGAGGTMPTSPRASHLTARLKARPEDALLLLSRRAVYALAGLLLAVALFGFAAGFLIGRGRRPIEADSVSSGETAAVDPVALEGSLIYSATPGNFQGDADSVVIALPVDQRPEQKLPSLGLRPADADDSQAVPAANALRKAQGAAARANAEGDFQLVVPQPGEYYLLLVSRQTKRAAEHAVGSADLAAMAEFFADPAGLIGANKYDWSRRRLAGVPAPLNHDFGASGK